MTNGIEIRRQAESNLSSLAQSVKRLSDRLGDKAIVWSGILRDVETLKTLNDYYANVALLAAAGSAVGAAITPLVGHDVENGAMTGALAGAALSTLHAVLVSTHAGLAGLASDHFLDRRTGDKLTELHEKGIHDRNPSDLGLSDADLKGKIDEGMRMVSRFQHLMEAAQRTSLTKDVLSMAAKEAEPHKAVSVSIYGSHKMEVAVRNMQQRAEEAIVHGTNCLNMLTIVHAPILRAKWGRQMLQVFDEAQKEARFVPSKRHPGQSMAEDFQALGRQLLAMVPEAGLKEVTSAPKGPTPPSRKGP
ncbi:MAG: hypothetical protein ACYCSN_10205 [Acidobacteriaceae bacterium]